MLPSDNDVLLFRGTTDGWPGNESTQQDGLTYTSTDPLVATLPRGQGGFLCFSALLSALMRSRPYHLDVARVHERDLPVSRANAHPARVAHHRTCSTRPSLCTYASVVENVSSGSCPTTTAKSQVDPASSFTASLQADLNPPARLAIFVSGSTAAYTRFMLPLPSVRLPLLPRCPVPSSGCMLHGQIGAPFSASHFWWSVPCTRSLHIRTSPSGWTASFRLPAS